MIDLEQSVRETWKILHATPELGTAEYKTAAFLAEGLRKAGYTVQAGIAGTGVTGEIKGKRPGKTLALLADMDALGHSPDGEPIHSCGHDANSAMVLTAAEELARGGIESGALKIIFQPAEESLTGAKSLIAQGVIDDVDRLIGMHFRPSQEAVLGQAMPAVYHSASYVVDAVITGLAAHGARPHLGCNAIDGAAAAVMAVNAIHLDPGISFSVKVTTLMAGGASSNVIPDKATLVLDLRSENNPDMETLIAKTFRALEAGAATVGAGCAATVRNGCPAAEYDAQLVGVVNSAIIDVLGEDGALPPAQTAGGEDFHFFVRHKPALQTAYVGLGADVTPSLHNPAMTFNPAALILGVQILLNAVRRLTR